jgi:hypothetical protein
MIVAKSIFQKRRGSSNFGGIGSNSVRRKNSIENQRFGFGKG